MSPTIRIDADVFDALKDHAEPFVDTPNTVLRRLLGLGETGAETDGDKESEGEVEGRSTTRAGSATPRPRQRRRRTRGTRRSRAMRGTILSESEYELPM